MPVSETRSVLLCVSDQKRLRPIIQTLGKRAEHLFEEVDAATIVPDDQLPANVVRMNSEVQVQDLNSGEQFHLKLVYPEQLDGSEGQVSVTAPVGAALIGLAVGEQIEWPLPYNKTRRLQVLKVEAQQ